MLEDDTDGTLNPGTRLGKYEIVRLLGAGGMGAVYEATHTEIGKRVAVKVLSPSIAAIPGARGRFLREAQLTSRVRHPNIVDVTDMGNEGRQTFLVMEFFQGQDLAQRVAQAGHLSPQEVADIMLPVCSAMVAAHQAGVTHRDLKPSNIFLSESQHAIEPKVLDFGISKSKDIGIGPDALTGTDAVVGTPFYLAPEQIMDNRAAGPASDQYALGVILYECLTGHRPFQSESLYAVFKEIVAGASLPPRAHRPDIPPSLELVVQRAMNVDPKSRFDSTKELGRALLPFASNRVRSIWEDAFGLDLPISDVWADATSGEIRIKRAVPATRVLTPLANVPAGGPVGLAGGTQVAMPGAPARPMGNRLAFSETGFPEAFDLRPKPSRWLPRLGIVGGLALAGMIAWFAFADAPMGIGQSEPAKRQKKVPGRSDADKIQADKSGETESTQRARSPEVFEFSVSVDPDTALIELDGRPQGRGHLERSLPVDHTPHRMRIVADGYDPEIVEFTDTPPSKRITLTPTPAPAHTVNRPPVEHDDAPSRRRHRHRRGREPRLPDNPQAPVRSGGINPNGAPVID
jgi:Protein kinase domain